MPADYRRLLWLLDYQGHAGLLRELVHHYPRAALDEWLAELEELGLIEPVPRGAEQTQDFVARAPDRTVALADVREAREDLARTGVYLALDRVKGRARWTRAPHETAILIVEDDPDQLALADLRVSMAGYQVRAPPRPTRCCSRSSTKARPTSCCWTSGCRTATASRSCGAFAATRRLARCR